MINELADSGNTKEDDPKSNEFTEMQRSTEVDESESLLKQFFHNTPTSAIIQFEHLISMFFLIKQ